MKILKWIGIVAVALIALLWYFSMGESEKRWLGVVIMLGWFLWFAGSEWDKAQNRARATHEAVQRIEARLEHLAQEVYALDRSATLIRRDPGG